MLESLTYSFRNPKNIIWVIYRIKQLRNYKKTMGSSEDPSLINSVDELGLVYEGLKCKCILQATEIKPPISMAYFLWELSRKVGNKEIFVILK